MSARAARYRTIRLLVLGAALLVGIGYPLVLALGGSVLVDVHAGRRGPTISVHNPRPWLVLAAVAAVALLAEQALVRARAASSPDSSGDDREITELTGRLAEARREVDALGAARRSEREWNAALDAQLAELWGGIGAARQDLATVLLELTMELVDARSGLVALADGAGLTVLASSGVGDPDRIAARVGVAPAGELQRHTDDDGGEWLVISLSSAAGAPGVIAVGERAGGFAGLDRDVLANVGQRAGALLDGATGRAPRG